MSPILLEALIAGTISGVIVVGFFIAIDQKKIDHSFKAAPVVDAPQARKLRVRDNCRTRKKRCQRGIRRCLCEQFPFAR